MKSTDDRLRTLEIAMEALNQVTRLWITQAVAREFERSEAEVAELFDENMSKAISGLSAVYPTPETSYD